MTPHKHRILTSQPFVFDILQYLQHEHSCHTVMLYGSYARGDFTPESDIDLLAVSQTAQTEYRLSHTWPNPQVDLDIFVHPDAQVQHLKPEDLSKLRGSVTLSDPYDIAAKLKKMVDAWVSIPPAPQASWERLQTLSWCKRMLRRAAKDDIEGHYRRHWLAMETLPMWFELKGRRFFGPKESLTWLQSHEPLEFEVFKKALHPEAQLHDLQLIVDLFEVILSEE